MAFTVDASFTQFFDSINLAGEHRVTANGRKDDIVAKLNKDFTIIEAFASGSIPKYTALKAHADLDVVVVLHYGKHIENKTPTQVLANVRQSLSQWRTGARRNGQAVTLKYVTWPDVDVVPVSRAIDNNGNVTHYNVPDSNTDTWITSKPKDHSARIETRSGACGPNFRKIIKMIKHWNRRSGDYLQSYHIEVLALTVFNVDLQDLPWQILHFFSAARPLLTSTLFYDVGIVDNYLSVADRLQVLSRFDAARDKARTAWYEGINNNQREAIGHWRQIFGQDFPAYG